MLLSGVYGGYFGAAQGVLVIGLLGSFLDESLQRVNAAKNVLVALVNATAAIVFILFAHVSWLVVLLIAAGSTIGGLLGAKFGRRLPPTVLRWLVVIIGVVAAVKLIFFDNPASAATRAGRTTPDPPGLPFHDRGLRRGPDPTKRP